MRIQKFGMESDPAKEMFYRVLLDIERRNLPDIGLYVTNNSGVRWNNHTYETLSCKLPQENRELHFTIVQQAVEGQASDLNALLVQTENLSGQPARVVWHQFFEAKTDKVGNLSFEVVRMFLNCTKTITSPRQGVELLYPAYGLQVPEVPKIPDMQAVMAAHTALPEVKDD
jgi:hypothetical protein